MNNVVNAVANARPEVRREMEQRILSGRYSSPDDVLRDVRAVTQEMAPVKLSFFCPLKGQVNEWDGGMEDTYNSTLLENQDKIEALLADEQQPEDGDMAEYLVGDKSELYAKLYLAEFCVEEIGGQLYGRIDCWFTQLIQGNMEKQTIAPVWVINSRRQHGQRRWSKGPSMAEWTFGSVRN